MTINLNELTREQLEQLRDEITLCSLYTTDFENSFGIPRDICQNFFDGYAEYLGELIVEDGHDDDEYFEVIGEYDNIDTLEEYYYCCEMPFGEELYNHPIITDEDDEEDW